ncbi:tRNA (adenosine(37)-N6)-threonylcarbamoyltransferase complex ATPase subunit type 1 TsaE [Sneathia sanguinegens]|jgi:hypothetical protein|uniref:tRNA threonylcarbamoyladenosine biosynthesis protein TsaE n=2 Tax=Sneathia TaxID=168808 RepID=A0ABT7HJM0_9FUSO|nr:tRNA (adenosine(37)-N6)-threonylcarbamoyltransferase complex ATPase subunit type 1 TsaE [Sneathia sanguinegens]MDK9580730.1 tRNA (adenosine(37)-N6)-threonylcarbamoyltransferase complex ATPase subunit type 1 TsaE [Sneathia sanguinegens]MDU4652099.1 tRNA (adenosine(37)-N6)-threonylcarbamoyltransferase complex ATPase subunit type 1 TsaE [Sneathia sanguinegens]MDU7497208.1 tRNA (adenosine(37)-N6)-threonylcarbamoyltransferase complex ATPase subunit type 1 TsaE [Sneathia sanguinegens]
MKIENKKLNFEQINEIITHIAKLISKNKEKSICIGLVGDLGTGKTTFAKKLLKDLGVCQPVKSPTFTFLIEYFTKDIDIAHFDVYRINNEESLYDIGYFDYIDAPGLILIEWADLIKNSLPDNCLFFEIKHDSLNTRYISIYTMKDGEKNYVDLYNYNFD